MKITKTYYYQFGAGLTPDALIPGFTAPSGKYTNSLDESALYPGSVYISVPFKVKKIHIKNITYKSGKNGGQGNTDVSNYITLISSLVGNRPVGMVHRDSQFSMATIQDIEHIFQIPEVINGYYNFETRFNDGTYAEPWDFAVDLGDPNPYDYWFDSFSITIEFNSEDEVF
jgi:hypothetical protein